MQNSCLNKYYDKGITGLVNLGNTCFLNSCLQALNHTYELNEILNTKNYNKYLKNIEDSEILKEWDDLRCSMWENNGIISPNKFVYNVHRIAKIKNREIFTGWSQNDMPEFLLFMIDCMHTSISRSVKIKISGNKKNKLDGLAIECYSLLKNVYEKEYSEIMDLFYGIYVSEIASIDGKVKHCIKPESFFILDLSIPNNRKCSLYDCFDLFTHSEYLTEDNAWFNEKTNKKEDIQKRISFWSFPKILVITLKRFSMDGQHKMDGLIDFPIENLDLSKYITGYNASSYKYDLYAVCNHIGNVYMGHYTAFVKNAKGNWLHFNDQSVENVENPSEIITPMAYCLFYRKKNNLV
jgi:ubiquitin carboxyl-terminal hydrolase 8